MSGPTIDDAIAHADKDRGRPFRPRCEFCQRPHKAITGLNNPRRGLYYCSLQCRNTDQAWFRQVLVVTSATDPHRGRGWLSGVTSL